MVQGRSNPHDPPGPARVAPVPGRFPLWWRQFATPAWQSAAGWRPLVSREFWDFQDWPAPWSARRGLIPHGAARPLPQLLAAGIALPPEAPAVQKRRRFSPVACRHRDRIQPIAGPLVAERGPLPRRSNPLAPDLPGRWHPCPPGWFENDSAAIVPAVRKSDRGPPEILPVRRQVPHGPDLPERAPESRPNAR